MRIVPFALAVALPLASAIPTTENLHKLLSRTDHAAVKKCPYANAGGNVEATVADNAELKKRFLVNSFKPANISGEHAFQPPNFANGDQRGPCPGLNTLANHGYIPHTGIAPFGQVIAAMNEVYGIGVDLATVLAVMGTVWTGDPLSLNPSFSIGGPDARVNNLLDNLGGILGEPQGLNGSHNFIESDSSLTRDDLYMTGNAHTLNMTKFMEWYNMSPDGTFDMDLMAERAKIRFHQSIETNPNFYYGPVTGFLARNAGYIFAGRVFGNHSAENPGGILTKEIVRNFFGIYGDGDQLEYREGWERLPENWYKTPVDFGLVQLNLEAVAFMNKYPELGSIGGNTGTVNSFTGLDFSDLTGGAMNVTTLLQKNNLVCFIMEALKFASPDSLSTLFTTLGKPLELITNAVATPLLDLACPAFKDLKMGGKPFSEAIQNTFPGAAKSKGGI